MTEPNMSDLSQSSANAVLTARACKALADVRRGIGLRPPARHVIERAASLLEGILRGSLLVERKEIAGFSGSHESLREYDRALSALQRLNYLTQESGTAELFNSYRERLRSIAQGDAVPDPELERLEQFFSALSSFFFSDVATPLRRRVQHRVAL